MKIDRLIGILAALSRHKKLAAPELAAMFEVSRRTINRDIEALGRAGIPVVTAQGQNGGISLMEGFCFDMTVFTKDDLSAIFTGLKTLDSVSNTKSALRLAKKIGMKSAVSLADDMVIDLSSFYKDDLEQKITMLKTAIQSRHRISFRYYYNKGEYDKLIEPYLIVFKWSDWYVFGYCTQRRDFRMYKLRRLWELRVCDEAFEMREVLSEKMQFGKNMTDDYFITAVYDASVKYKLVEEGGPGSFTILEDGRILTNRGFTDPDEALSRFLGFGDKVTVIAPPEFKEKLKAAAENILEKYKQT